MPPLPDEPDNEDDHIFSSTTNRPPRQPEQPGGTGDDPMVLTAMQSAGYLRLEGNPPTALMGTEPTPVDFSHNSVSSC